MRGTLVLVGFTASNYLDYLKSNVFSNKLKIYSKRWAGFSRSIQVSISVSHSLLFFGFFIFSTLSLVSGSFSVSAMKKIIWFSVVFRRVIPCNKLAGLSMIEIIGLTIMALATLTLIWGTFTFTLQLSTLLQPLLQQSGMEIMVLSQLMKCTSWS